MIGSNIDKAMERLDQMDKVRNQFSAMSFESFLEMLVRSPRQVLRNIFQFFHDMVKAHIGEGYDEYQDDPESIGFRDYDCTRLFVEGSDNPFFADRLFANRLVRLVENLRRGSQQNKIYIFDGPPGCGKSTFLNNLLRKFEEYANTDDGLRLEVNWRLDRKLLGDHSAHPQGPLIEKLHRLLGEAEEWEESEGGADEGKAAWRERQPGKADNSYLHGAYVEVPCPSHDHPILMVPRPIRRQFLEDLFHESDFLDTLLNEKEYEWVLRDEPCTICQALYQSLLDRLKSHRKVMGMVFTRPYVFNRRLGEGISIFNPGDVTTRRPFFTDPVLQRRINMLMHGAHQVQYVYSRYAQTNNGIYALMDIKQKNTGRLVELHNIISEGVHKVETIEESVSSLFLALMNPEDKVNIEGIPSFSDRVEYVNIPYVLDIRTEIKILLSVFGSHVKAHFLPRVLENFARIIVSTRMKTHSRALTEWLGSAEKYKLYCDKHYRLLKMELYAGLIPSWLAEEDLKRFNTKVRRKLLAESEAEGRKGLSGRDSIKIFSEFHSRYAKEGKLINMNMLYTYFTKVRKDLSEQIPTGFLDALLSLNDYTVLQQVKEALYYYNEERIAKDIQNYLFALNYDPGVTAVCEYTGETLVITEEYLAAIEFKLLGRGVGAARRKEFRKETQRKFTSKTLTQEMLLDGIPINKTGLFVQLRERYVYNLKEKVLDPFIENENFRRAIKDYGTEDFKTYDNRIKNEVTFMMNNLQEKHHYTSQGAKEVCMDIIDRGLVGKFNQEKIRPEPQTS
jgi:predicted Ser/Thr protein kinase